MFDILLYGMGCAKCYRLAGVMTYIVLLSDDSLLLGFYLILALALANPKSGHFGNVAKSGSGQISSRIWWMLMQLMYIKLITDKTPNAAGNFSLTRSFLACTTTSA